MPLPRPPRRLLAPFLGCCVFGGVTGYATTPVLLGSAGGDQAAPGLFLADFDPASGTLSAPRRLTDTQPFFFRPSRDGTRIFVTGHVGTSASPGVLRTLALDRAAGTATELGVVATHGRTPLHLSVSADEAFVLVAHYSTPNVVSVPVAADGSLGPPVATVTLSGRSIHPERQDHAYPHSVNLSPDQRFAYVCDRGTDRIAGFAFDPASGALTPLGHAMTALPGAGPRHLAWHPDGSTAYVINEINGSLTPYAYDPAQGHLTAGPSHPTLAIDDTRENFSAEVVVHPNGRFIYVSNRGPDTLAVFARDPAGSLRRIQIIPTGGGHPRYFAIDATGRWLIVSNRHSDLITVFALDPATGRLSATAQSLSLPTPLGLAFVP